MRMPMFLLIAFMLVYVGFHSFAQDANFGSDFPKASETREFGSLEEAKSFLVSAPAVDFLKTPASYFRF